MKKSKLKDNKNRKQKINIKTKKAKVDQNINSKAAIENSRAFLSDQNFLENNKKACEIQNSVNLNHTEMCVIEAKDIKAHTNNYKKSNVCINSTSIKNISAYDEKINSLDATYTCTDFSNISNKNMEETTKDSNEIESIIKIHKNKLNTIDIKNNEINKDTEMKNNIDNEYEEDDVIKRKLENGEIKIDTREYSYYVDFEIKDSKFRDLNVEDMKKIKRHEKEEKGILELHSDLKKQEELFVNAVPTNFDILSQPKGLVTKLMDFQLYGISWMKSREESIVKGGILADEMGMGKTLQALGLILSSDNRKEKTLIVTPAIALNQWIFEINKHAPEMFIVIHYHGRNKKDKIELAKQIKERVLKEDNKFLIFLTTYGTISSEYRRKNGLLYDNKFYRIIIDEAHSIKDSTSSTCTAVSSIDSVMRWGLTGTPVQNRIGDLYSLVKYLRLDPHSYYFCKKCPCKSLKWLNYDKKKEMGNTELIRRGFCTCGHFGAMHFGWWNRRITSQIKNYGYTEKGEEVFSKLRKITSHIILRRTKNELADELGLPSKIVILHRRYFSEQEKDFYTSIYKKTQTKFMSYAVSGHVNTHYMHIFELLQKMRLAVNHPYLAIKNVNEGIPICGYCNEEADDPIISKCNHIFCREEAREFLQLSNLCPVCKLKISIDLNQEADFTIKTSKIFTENWTSSTKIEFLIEKLTELKSKNQCVKNIVFSQFVNFLEILRWRLERAGFRCVNIYGSMPIAQRKAAIEVFNNDDKITVFLISLKAGGLALNLTEASNVFLMDLWWNPAVEEQAMDRIHRIGQHRPITINRVIIHDSIESRILKLQEKKKALFDSTIDNDITALGRLTEDDLFFLFAN